MSRLSDKFAKSETVRREGKNKARSNVHTSRLEIEVADREKQSSGSDRGNIGQERRRMRSGSLSEKYSYDEQELTVEFPNAN